MSIMLIIINIFITFNIVEQYDLKIGMMSLDNYFLLQAIISKPWTKL